MNLLLTPEEINAPGAQQMIDGGVRTAMPPAMPTAPAPTPAPTVGETLGTQTSVGFETPDQTVARAQTMLDSLKAGTGAGSEFTTGGFGTEETFTPFDEDEARRQSMRDQLRLHQAEIDATNRIFDAELGQARVEGMGRLGSQRAGAARGGLLGSDFAGAQKERVQDFNQEERELIGAQRAAAIGAIMGRVRSSVQSEIAEKREARAQSAEEYLNFLTRSDERKESNLQQVVGDLISQGFNPNDLGEAELKEMLKGSALSVNDVIAGYAQAQFAQEAEGGEDFGFMSTSGGIFRTDSSSGEATFIPSGGATGSGSGGSTSSGGGVETEAQSDFDIARQLISDNPNASPDEIKSVLFERTKLNVSEINSLMGEGRIVKEDVKLTPEQNKNVAIATRKAMADFGLSGEEELQAAIEYIESGEITSNGKKVTLTNKQIEDIVNELNNLGERTFLESVLPGGR